MFNEALCDIVKRRKRDALTKEVTRRRQEELAEAALESQCSECGSKDNWHTGWCPRFQEAVERHNANS